MIGKLVRKLSKKPQNNEPEQHERPWGYYRNLFVNPDFIVKEIVVFPHRRLSLQRHFYRNEHWYVLFGDGIAIVDNKEIKLNKGMSIDIEKEQIHRLINKDVNAKLIILEIQTGHCDENDIERLEDDYGRGPAKPIEW